MKFEVVFATHLSILLLNRYFGHFDLTSNLFQSLASGERATYSPMSRLSNAPSPNPLLSSNAISGRFYSLKPPKLGLKMAAIRIQDIQTSCNAPKSTTSTEINSRPPENVQSTRRCPSFRMRPSPPKSDQSSQIEVNFGYVILLIMHTDYIISRSRVISMHRPLNQSETSDTHMPRFKLTNHSTLAYDIMPRHASCRLLIGRFPHDSSRLRTSEFKISSALPQHAWDLVLIIIL